MAGRMTNTETNEEPVRRKGGRRKGDSGRRNDGLFKRCGCSRKRWSECLDDWWCSWTEDHRTFRFNLTKRAGLKRKTAMARTEMEPIRESFVALSREGKIDRRG